MVEITTNIKVKQRLESCKKEERGMGIEEKNNKKIKPLFIT